MGDDNRIVVVCCTTYRDVGSVDMHEMQGFKLFTEWKECTVSGFSDNDKQERQRTYNVRLGRIRITIVVVEKQ